MNANPTDNFGAASEAEMDREEVDWGGPAEEENSSNGSNDDEDKDEERGRGG